VSNEGLVTADDIAELLKVSIRQVQDLAAKKELPAYRIGGAARGSWRFRREEIEQWLARQHNQTPQPEAQGGARP